MELHVIEREGRETVVLLDNEMRIVKPVYDYLKFQRQKDKALNTLKASGSDLRTYWEFLNDSGYEYDKVTPKMIAEFIDYLRASDDDVIALKRNCKRHELCCEKIQGFKECHEHCGRCSHHIYRIVIGKPCGIIHTCN